MLTGSNSRADVDLARGLEAVEDRHAHVHQDDVRVESLRELDRLTAVTRLPHDLDPLVGREDRLERLGEEPVVVGDEDAERLRLRLARTHPSILPC